MPIEVGVDSYVDVQDSEDYFASRFFLEKSAWEEATEEAKEQALTSATDRIEQLDFVGVKSAADQTLSFPRAYSAMVEQEVTVHFEPDVLPAIKRAVMLEALAIISGHKPNQRAQLQAQGVTSSRIGSVAETYSGGGNAVVGLASPDAERLLKPYIKAVASFG